MTIKYQQLRVKDLVEMLTHVPDNALVVLEGCDCNGPCDGLEYEHQKGIVRLTRNDEAKP